MEVAKRLSIVTDKGLEFELYPELQTIPEGAITEATTCEFHLSGNDVDVFSCNLSVNDEILDRIAVSERHAMWKWAVGFHAGLIELALSGVRAQQLKIALVTDPARYKLTRSQYHTMIGDILEDSLALLGIGGFRFGFAKGDVPPPDIARIEYLRQCILDVAQAVRSINENPLYQLKRAAESKPLPLAGRITPLELSNATRFARRLSDEELANLTANGHRLANAMNGCLPKSIDVARAKVTRHRREHCDILAILQMWIAFLSMLSRKLDSLPESESNSIRRVRYYCKDMMLTLRTLSRLPLFDGVTPTRGQIYPSQVFRRRRHYREFFRAYQQFSLGLGRVTGDFLNIPLRRTYDLYEQWCFLRLVRAASTMPEADKDFRSAFEERGDGTGLLLNIKAKPFKVGKFRLIFKPSYSEIWKLNGPTVGSFSRTMCPDMAIEGSDVTTSNLVPALVLDAKYRVNEQINNAITSIHTYRDALVKSLGSDSVERTVQVAAVVVPHIPFEHSGDWKELDTPSVFFRDEYFGAFRFGAVVMRPGISSAECRTLLQSLISMISLPD